MKAKAKIKKIDELYVVMGQFRNGLWLSSGGCQSTKPKIYDSIGKLKSAITHNFVSLYKSTMYRYRKCGTENDLFILRVNFSGGEIERTWYPKIVGIMKIPRDFHHIDNY